jgi:hypothetical protein
LGADYVVRLRASITPSRLEAILAKHALMDDETTIGNWVQFDRS